MKKLIFLIIYFCFSNYAFANEIPPEIKANFSNPKMLGSANLAVFGKNVYDISMWVETSESKQNYQNKFALNINYNRDVPKKNLVTKAIKEMIRIHKINKNQADNYQAQLNNLLSDAKTGDTRTNIFDQKTGLKLYKNGKLVGEIKDLTLAKYFTDNWLSPDAEFQSVRNKLLGEDK